MDYTRLGKRIREERLRLTLTQYQLAEDIDISDTYMSAIECVEQSLTLDTLVRLVNRLGVTLITCCRIPSLTVIPIFWNN